MNIEENLYPRLSKSFSQAGAEFPQFLATNFARILQRIEFLWGEKELGDYLDSLFLLDAPDDKKNLPSRTLVTSRQGFPVEAMKEIVRIKQVYQLLYPTIGLNPYDPFSGSEIVPLEKIFHKDAPQEGSPASETGNATDVPKIGAPTAAMRRKFVWPIIRSQSDLAEIARLQQKGENIYPTQNKSAGEILMHYGVIDEDTLRIVQGMQNRAAHKNKPVGDILLEIGIIKQEDLTRMLLIQAGIPMVDVLSIEIPIELAKLIPHAMIREKLAQPIGLFQDTLYLAVGDPFSFKDQTYFTMKTGLKVSLVYAPAYEVVNRINMHGVIKKTARAANEEMPSPARNDRKFPEEKERVASSISEPDADIDNLVNQTILKSIQGEASDIHFELFNDGKDARIRVRREGKMETIADYPRDYHKAVVSRIKSMSGMDISEKKRPQDGKISFGIPDGGQVDLQVTTIPAMPEAEFVTLRIRTSAEPLPLGTLGMASRDENELRQIFHQPYGLFLVCGPSGSGKTTTLHSVLKEINTEDRKIWTAEDPVEIVQPNLCQVQINSKVGMTYTAALRSFLRTDTDVIMIGEMRDQEIAKIALEASMTGHLVLSTLRAGSASETVDKLINLNIDPYDLSETLLGILAQRLARKLCPVCARREEASASDIEDLAGEYYQSAHSRAPTLAELNTIIQQWHEKFGIEGKLHFMRAVGCEMCRGGYKGHIGLFELLLATPQLRHLMRQRSAAPEYLAMGVAHGMHTLKQDGIEKVIRGITDMSQVHGACI